MSNTRPFIKSIQVEKVRHLQDISILIDEFRPRHLILTGPNGSGKTSLLCCLKDYLEGIPNRQLQVWKEAIDSIQTEINEFESKLDEKNTDGFQAAFLGIISDRVERKAYFSALISQLSPVKPDISDLAALTDAYHKGEFLISFFEAKRVSQIQPVNGAQKLDLPKVNPIAVNTQALGSRFLQFLVNQKNRAALLSMKGDQAGVDEIETWMNKLTEKFRDLFQNQHLTMEYDIDNFDFTINIPGREPFRLVDNELSDGFSAVIQIVAELLMRMEAVSAGSYSVPGIVLIDEIETHLHIRLQKAVLPFLTDFFPNIQFIVTTHSPFVLTSLNDAVVFDLESKQRWEHMAPMSASTVVESYFDLDLYSDEIKNLVSRFDELVKNVNRTEADKQELDRIRTQLDEVDYESAPELVAQYRSLCAKEKESGR